MASAPATDDPREEPPSPYERIGGRAVLQRIVDRFYDLMDSDPSYTALRAMHAPDLAPMRRSLAGFLVAWCGGPRDWFEENPGKCMMSAHSGFVIGPDTADQWAEAMLRAVVEIAPADSEIAHLFAGRLGQIARAMAVRS